MFPFLFRKYLKKNDMEYFIIHSGNDYSDRIEPVLKSWAEKHPKLKFTALTGKQQNWIGIVENRIKQADKVIYIVGAESYRSENIEKELEIVFKENKFLYIYKLKKSYAINANLEQVLNNAIVDDGNVDGEKVVYLRNSFVYVNENDIDSFFERDEHAIIGNLKAENFDDKQIKLEQYKFFVQTSEELVKRKQTVNSFYIAINSVILGAIVTVLCAIKDLPVIWTVSSSVFLSIFIALIGVVVSISWLSLINSYARLNSSKMALISALETNLALNLYDTEWKIMQQKAKNKKVLSFSQKEKYVAYVFLALYLLFVVAGVVIAAFVK